MTPQQLEIIGTVVTVVGGLAAVALALAQTIKTLLEVADQLAKRRRRARRRGPRPLTGCIPTRRKRLRQDSSARADSSTAPATAPQRDRCGHLGATPRRGRAPPARPPPGQNLRPRAPYCLDGLHVASARDCTPYPPRRGQNLSFS